MKCLIPVWLVINSKSNVDANVTSRVSSTQLVWPIDGKEMSRRGQEAYFVAIVGKLSYLDV